MVREFATNEEVSSIDFNTDSTRAITGSSLFGRAILWDVATGKEIKRFSYSGQGAILSAVFGPDDSTILGSCTGALYLWDVETAKIIRRYKGIPTFPWSLTISPDGKYVFSGTSDGTMILWDFSTREELYRSNLLQPVFSVIFSPDSRIIYAASRDGKMVELHIAEQSLPELLKWIDENRYVRELNCDERQQYRVEPLCKP